jgi:hypothetical protein
MIRHIVLMRLAPETTDDQRAAIAAGIASLPSKIPEIVSISCGSDVGVSVGNADFAVVAEFGDEAAYLVYAQHPDHLLVIAELIRPVLAERNAVQYRFDR